MPLETPPKQYTPPPHISIFPYFHISIPPYRTPPPPHYSPFRFISIAIVTSLLNPALNLFRCLRLFSRFFFFPGLSWNRCLSWSTLTLFAVRMPLSLDSACGRSVMTDTVRPADGPVRGVGFAPRGGAFGLRELSSVGRIDENLGSRRGGAVPVPAASPKSSASIAEPGLAGGGVPAGVGAPPAAGRSPAEKRGECENRRIAGTEAAALREEQEEKEDEQQEE